MAFLRRCLQEVRAIQREWREGDLLDYVTDTGGAAEALSSQSRDRSAVAASSEMHADAEGESRSQPQVRLHLGPAP